MKHTLLGEYEHLPESTAVKHVPISSSLLSSVVWAFKGAEIPVHQIQSNCQMLGFISGSLMLEVFEVLTRFF